MINIFKLFERKNPTNKLILDLEDKVFGLERQIIDLQSEIVMLTNDNGLLQQQKSEALNESRRLKEKLQSLDTVNENLQIKINEIADICRPSVVI